MFTRSLYTICIPICIIPRLFTFLFKHCLFDKDYEINYITCTHHSYWHFCLRSYGLCVAGNQSARRKPTCATWWPYGVLSFCVSSGQMALMYRFLSEWIALFDIWNNHTIHFTFFVLLCFIWSSYNVFLSQ